jgi:hypothetical protein
VSNIIVDMCKVTFNFQLLQQVDLCFLVDCTGSMGSYIEAVKNNVKQLRDDLVEQYKGCDIRFAFVRYTDYDVASNRTTFINFTKDQATFYQFVSGISANGGGDGPEDIMGGLKVALNNLSWRPAGSRVLVHIADCPCHGTMYHNMPDNYPNGDREGITHEQMMANVKDREVDYWFGYINRGNTDKMISIFNDCLQRVSNQRLLIRQFDAMQPTEVRASVHRSVSASIYGSQAAKKARLRKYKIDSTIPEWQSTSLIENYGQKTPAVGMKSLYDLQAGLLPEQPTIPIAFKCAPNPFAEGSECLVYHGYDLTNKRAMVLKKYKREGAEFNSLDCYMREIEVRTICTTYASHFNNLKTKPPGSARLEVVPVDVVSCPGQDYYLMETFLGGEVEKYSNNAGVVCSKSPHSELLQAFSHFTWVVSGKSLVICDLQGVEGSGRVTLTDPAIHSSVTASTYGHTDLGTFLGGEVEKYSNNAGVVCSKSPHSELLQAFSHFTWVVSGKSLVICDLQGVEGSGRVTLTDPAIHSSVTVTASTYGHTDLGQQGIHTFFKTHLCGDVCRVMGFSIQIP